LAGTAGFGRGGLLSVAACLAGSPGPTAVALAWRTGGDGALPWDRAFRPAAPYL